MDPKTYEQNASKPPLIAQIPPTIAQMPMLPQHVITSGIEKNCIRLRGLPYEAKVEHILHFLEDFAKHIVYQGVHLVYNAQVRREICCEKKTNYGQFFQGQFNGEAFIQMDSDSAAQASAQQKHHKHMLFGKKQRYIEVFQCSGDDMNLVLQGGYQQFQTASAINAKHPSGMLPSSRPQQSPVQPLQVSIPPPLSIPLSISQAVLPTAVATSTNHSSASVAGGGNQTSTSSLIAHQQQQAHFIAHQNLMARQQAAAIAQLQAQHQAASDPMAFLQNYGFLPSSAINSAGVGSASSANMGAASGNPYSYQMSQMGQMGQQMSAAPQFYYVPRPMLPMSLMHTPGMNPYASLQMNPNALSSMPVSTTSLASTSVKRSYESAFRNDPMTVSAAKRAYQPNQPHTTNFYGGYNPYQQM